MSEVSLLRLYLLRAGYLLIAVGLGIQIWPELLAPGKDLQLQRSVVLCMLAALSLLALLGVRYPLRMLPLLLFEMTWKALWLLKMALPRWMAGNLDGPTAENAFACLIGAIFVFLVPWRYIATNYLLSRGDPWWRSARSPVPVSDTMSPSG